MIEQRSITLTPDAVGHLKALLADEVNPEVGLRIFVSGGGCSGLQYGMALDDTRRPGDDVVEMEGVKILIDDYSAPYLRGSEVDYVNSLMGAGFTVHNPNAVSSCSCGTSFNAGDGEGEACGCSH
ncbi:MAG TPA: iron-sulfur cluster insertion protein ErpA [Candidatus Acidoferrales bacterium]|nr:iron-sulfur cluster insertion protein ErpA [Candidatus Acidoferrales bacterium]